jgi:hypothetical protein
MLDRTVLTYTEGKGNKALEKLAQESVQGLSLEDPLHPTETKTYHSTAITGARRDSGNFFEQLSDDEQKAAHEIREGHMDASGIVNMRAMTFGRVTGKTLDEYTEYRIELLKRYDAWRGELYKLMPEVLNCCIDVLALGMNFTEASQHQHGIISPKTVKRYCLTGIREYVSINGGKK